MDDEAVFAGCARLRRQVADWLVTLTPDQLATTSLCPGWSVQQVAGHLLAAVAARPTQLLVRVVRCRFDVHRANAELGRAMADRSVTELADLLRARSGVELRFPGVGTIGPLCDLLVHTGDMRLPLGLAMEPEPALTVAALGAMSRGLPGFVPRHRLRGLSLVPTDASERWLEGAEVRGRLSDLIMAVTGRRATLDRLDGPGVGVLADRI